MSTEVEGHSISLSVDPIPSDVSVQTGLLQVNIYSYFFLYFLLLFCCCSSCKCFFVSFFLFLLHLPIPPSLPPPPPPPPPLPPPSLPLPSLPLSLQVSVLVVGSDYSSPAGDGSTAVVGVAEIEFLIEEQEEGNCSDVITCGFEGGGACGWSLGEHTYITVTQTHGQFSVCVGVCVNVCVQFPMLQVLV